MPADGHLILPPYQAHDEGPGGHSDRHPADARDGLVGHDPARDERRHGRDEEHQQAALRVTDAAQEELLQIPEGSKCALGHILGDPSSSARTARPPTLQTHLRLISENTSHDM